MRDPSFGLGWLENRFLLEIFGQDGYIVVDGLGGSYGVERLTVGRRHPTGGPPEEMIEAFPGEDSSWRAEWEEFIGAIHEGREPMANGYEGWQAMCLIDAVYESALKSLRRSRVGIVWRSSECRPRCFPYQEEGSRVCDRIARPRIAGYLKTVHGNWLEVFPYADSGADVSVFPRSVARILG